MLATCIPTDTTEIRSTRRRKSTVVAAPEPVRPTRLTMAERVDLLREYRAHPGLSPAQCREAVAWITGHPHESA